MACRVKHSNHFAQLPQFLRPSAISLASLAVLSAVSLAGVLSTGSAHAQTQAQGQAQGKAQSARSYNLPAGPLGASLSAFASQAGVLLSFDPALTRGLQAPALQGNHTAQSGFNALLAGSGLRAVMQPDGSYSLQRMPVPKQDAAGASSSVDTLPAITVTAAPDLSGATEGTGRYTAAGASTSATRLNMTVQETPQAVSVITRQQMDDAGLQSVGDVLAYSTGAFSVGPRVDGDRTFSVRGFDVSSFSVDGLQGSYIPAQRGSFNSIDFDTILYDRVEIVRGATGLTTGSGDPSASVNMIRKRPGKSFDANAALTLGSWRHRQAMADISTPITSDGSVRARLIGGARAEDSFKDRQARDGLTLSGVLEADLGPSTVLTLGHDYQRSDLTAPNYTATPTFFTTGELVDLPRSIWLTPSWAYWNKRYQQSFVYLDHQFDNGWKAKAALSHHRNRGDMLLADFTLNDLQRDGSGVALYTNMASQSARSQNNFEISASGPFELLGRRHEASFGINGYRARNTSYLMDFSPEDDEYEIPNIFHWDGTGLARPDTFRTGASQRTAIEQSGAFAAVRLHVAEPVHLIGGLRLSNYKTWRNAYDTSGAYTGTSARLRNSGVLTPYAGITWAITPDVTAYASYTGIFQPQSYRDKNDNYLDPIEGRSAELGLKTELLDKRLNLNLAVFQSRQDNLAEIDPTVPENSLPDGSQAYRSTGKGNKIRGAEVELAGQVRPGWNAYASYSHTSAKNAQGERILRQNPPSMFRLGSQWELPGQWAPLSLGAQLSWYGKRGLNGRSSVDIPGVGTVTPIHPSYALLDLSASYRINNQWQANLRVLNVTNKKYYANFTSWGVSPGAPRSAYLTLRYQY